MPARPAASRVRLAAALVLAPLLASCAVLVSGTPTPAPPRTLDGAQLERDVRAVLAADPSTAALASAPLQCPQQVVVYPQLVLFCQVQQGAVIRSVPVTVLDRDGNYQVGKPF
ncbi:DUF4333 domain-containing protein [Pseudonocardia kujensis]|uniref:DUF4333 domain-containing protein n=1 Tax=Pseudonocardia kujensis TaxID=1128675 RepID=UPI001E5240B9|nr:DUF4333 domain-containing protein [Pseudonocardia kujensis]MCE0765907.1 DUF4333 domain-containing protein [Pseudonocardia kujensis]